MPEQLKILYMIHDSRRSGVPAVAANFIKIASSVDVTPTVLFAYDGAYAEDLRAVSIQVVTLGERTPLLWRMKRFLMNSYLLVHGREFAVIHIHSIKLVWSVLVAKRLGLKVVFHIHELPKKIDWLLRRAMLAADMVVYCSETCAAHFENIPTRKCRTVVNAMEFSTAAPVQHGNGELRIVMAASINRNKGQDLLLKAFARMENRDAKLWLYGTTGLSAHKYVYDLKRFAVEHGVAERVFFPGPTADVLAVFSRAAVVVHTSLTESFGMVLVEAMSCGVPVIAHNLEGMREVVTDGITGYLIQPGDLDALARRLDELLSAPNLRNNMGGAAYHLMRDRFDIKLRAEEYRQIYQEICAP